MTMNKTIFITGASSGIGKATATFFAENGWDVIATMRNPEKIKEAFKKYPNIKLLTLDVLEEKSIKKAFSDSLKACKSIDVLFNNAGYGLVGPFESMTQEQIRQQIDTNLIGTMNVTHEFIPYFRERKQGIIITTTSMGGLLTFPLYSIYHATKWALEGFLESLQFELKQFNIKVKNIEPGSINTDFYDRSIKYAEKKELTDYDRYFTVVNKNMLNALRSAPGPEVVAKKVFEAANDASYRLRYPVGGSGPVLIFLRRILPFNIFRLIMKIGLEKGF